jgi:UDP-glucose 4-epimerase
VKYLITGGGGFIGSHLAESYLSGRDAVTIIDDFSTGRVDNIRSLLEHPDLSVVNDSILDEHLLDRLVDQADVVVHLAAAVGVKYIVDHPVRGITVNIHGTHNVLKCAARYGTKVVIASSSEVYGKGVRIPFSESDDILLGPSTVNRWSYAASKLVDEFLALGYAQEYGVPVVVARLFNTVGPRQTGAYGMVIPRLTGQALRGEPLTVYGDGSQRRCFCHVRDVARALLALASEPEAVGQVFNVGGTEEVSIATLAQRILEATQSRSAIEYVSYADAYGANFEDIQRRVPDITRITSVVGWRPEVALDQILFDVRDDLLMVNAQNT